MTLKKRLATYYVKWKIRCGLGNSYTGEIAGFVNSFSAGGVILLLVDKYFDILIPLALLPILWFAQKMIEYFIGRYDEKHLRLIHLTNRYNSTLDPWKQEVLECLKRIENK